MLYFSLPKIVGKLSAVLLIMIVSILPLAPVEYALDIITESVDWLRNLCYMWGGGKAVYADDIPLLGVTFRGRPLHNDFGMEFHSRN